MTITGNIPNGLEATASPTASPTTTDAPHSDLAAPEISMERESEPSPVGSAVDACLAIIPISGVEVANATEQETTSHEATNENDPTPPPARFDSDHGTVNDACEAAEASDAAVIVNVKFLHRDRVAIRCPPSILIRELKELVHAADATSSDEANAGAGHMGDDAASHGNDQTTGRVPGRPPALRLIYKGKVLKDDQSLASYGFTHEDTIHAVVSRPSVQFSEGNAEDTAQGSDMAAQDTAAQDSHDESQDSSPGTPPTDLGSGYFVRHFTINTGDNASISGIANAIGSVLNTVLSGAPPTGLAGPTGPTQPMSASINVPSSPQITTVRTEEPNTIDADTAGRVQETTNQHPLRSLQREALSIRTSMPPIELAPLSRPNDLSHEMYNMGNALREAGDTYMAAHRQLAFLASRFLQENHLTPTERASLSHRVQQLIPTFRQMSAMSSGVADRLSFSPFGQLRGVAEGTQDHTSQRPSQVGPAPATGTLHIPAGAFVTNLLRSLGSNGNEGPAAVNTPNTPAMFSPELINYIATIAPGTIPLANSVSHRQNTPSSTQHPSSSRRPLHECILQIAQVCHNAGGRVATIAESELLALAVRVISQYMGAIIDGDQPVDSARLIADRCADELELALENVLDVHDHQYIQDPFRKELHLAIISRLMQSFVAGETHDSEKAVILSSALRKFCMGVFLDLTDLATPSESIGLVGEIIDTLVTRDTDTSSVYRDLGKRLKRQAKTFLKARVDVMSYRR